MADLVDGALPFAVVEGVAQLVPVGLDGGGVALEAGLLELEDGDAAGAFVVDVGQDVQPVFELGDDVAQGLQVAQLGQAADLLAAGGAARARPQALAGGADAGFDVARADAGFGALLADA